MMKKRETLLLAGLMLAALGTRADDVVVNHWQNKGTQAFKTPFMVDSVDVFGGKYRGDSTLTALVFDLENTHYTKATLNVKNNKNYKLLVDGNLMPGKGTHQLTLLPATHTVEVRYGGTAVPQITIHTDTPNAVTLPTDGKRLYTLNDVMYNTRVVGASLSPNGKYMISVYRTTLKSGKQTTLYKISSRANGKVMAESPSPVVWMPRSNRYLVERQGQTGRSLVAMDPVTGDERVLVEKLPEGRYQMSPTEDFLLFTTTRKGPQERTDVFEVIEPDDRQPGWRDRTSLSLYNLKTHQLQPLTFGHSNVQLLDISPDGRKVLFCVSRRRLEKRPTTLMSVYNLDLGTMQADEIVKNDGFINTAAFSPDGRSLLVSGSPECLDGIGKNVLEGQTPSMFDYQLYLVDAQSHQAKALTKNFNPNVKNFQWSKADGMVYFMAEHKDSVCLYRLNPYSDKIARISVNEDVVEGFNLAGSSSEMVWWGQSASNSDRLYALDTKSRKSTLIDDVSARNLKGITLGDCLPWTYKNSRGDILTARYCLPPHFDASKQYPMIVNYYGGCSPVSRNLESRYPAHVYAAQGYVVLVLEPSGCTGFGQEFAARHVNAYGDYTADDIIEGTTLFCQQHPWVNSKKVGCIGASYGGFMTQYLQTKTDIFAAAISHAGISDITGYWGFGYWGYSYNEVAAADSYPWDNKELYVDHSPLYNADKIHTPLLFLHGTADHNVPTAQSVAMYTALKLLGRETALVEVTGQDHHIIDYAKRVRWEQTIYAWFAKWLQDDPTWWNAMYPKKNL